MQHSCTFEGEQSGNPTLVVFFIPIFNDALNLGDQLLFVRHTQDVLKSKDIIRQPAESAPTNARFDILSRKNCVFGRPK